MAEIDVIVPVYNAGKTIQRLMDAVLQGSFQDFSLLLCDDGSTDDSAALCEGYARKDRRVRVIKLWHGGVSAARNAGIRVSTAPYIAFADSDDEPAPDWLASLYINMGPRTLAVCGYDCCHSSGDRAYGTLDYWPASDSFRQISPVSFLEALFSNEYMYQGYVWNKLFDGELIRQECVSFDENVSLNEDRLFLTRYLTKCAEVRYSGTPQYTYFLKDPDIAPSPDKAMDEIAAFQKIRNILQNSACKRALRFAKRDELRAAAALLPACRQEDKDLLQRLVKADFPFVFQSGGLRTVPFGQQIKSALTALNI